MAGAARVSMVSDFQGFAWQFGLAKRSSQDHKDEEEYSIYSGGSSTRSEKALAAERVLSMQMPDVEAEEVIPLCEDHELTESTADNPVICSSCDRVQTDGVAIFVCSVCTGVICSSCNWMDAMDLSYYQDVSSVGSHSSRSSSEGDIAIFLPLEGEDPAIAQASTSSASKFKQEVPKIKTMPSQEVSNAADELAILPENGHSGEGTKSGSLQVDGTGSNSLQPRATPRRTLTGNSSLMSGKVCSRCREPYKGFGDVCTDCRKSGPLGTPRVCRRCQVHFSGFGPMCSDCHEKDDAGL